MSEELVLNFSAITQTPDLALCRAILNANGNSLAAALNDFYANGVDGAAASAPRAAPQRPRRGLVRLLRVIFDGMFTFSITVRQRRRRRQERVCACVRCDVASAPSQLPSRAQRCLVCLPRALKAARCRRRRQVVRAVVTLVVSPLVGPARLRAARQALSARAEEDPAAAAAMFVHELADAYGSRHPRFLQCSYRDALQRAQQESKFLLLYLHSQEHQVCATAFSRAHLRFAYDAHSRSVRPPPRQSTPAFCTQTLCSEAVTEFVDTHLLLWGGDVRHSEAYQARCASVRFYACARR
jgi:hypothetical protein